MNLLGALFLQVMMIRWIVGLAIPLIVGFAFIGDTSRTFSSLSRNRLDPGIARASDEWREAPQRVKTVSASSEEAIEAAVIECMEAWESRPLEPRDQFNRLVDTGPAARDALRPLTVARCRRSARYQAR